MTNGVKMKNEVNALKKGSKKRRNSHATTL